MNDVCVSSFLSVVGYYRSNLRLQSHLQMSLGKTIVGIMASYEIAYFQVHSIQEMRTQQSHSRQGEREYDKDNSKEEVVVKNKKEEKVTRGG